LPCAPSEFSNLVEEFLVVGGSRRDAVGHDSSVTHESSVPTAHIDGDAS
jgi:hypothetical protein